MGRPLCLGDIKGGATGDPPHVAESLIRGDRPVVLVRPPLLEPVAEIPFRDAEIPRGSGLISAVDAKSLEDHVLLEFFHCTGEILWRGLWLMG